MILLEPRRRRERSDRLRGSQQIEKHGGGIELALLNRAEDAGEHFVSVGTASGAAATTNSAGNDGGAQGLFGAPISRVDRWVEQKREDRRVFDREMRGEALSDTATSRLIDESIESILQMAAGDGDAVCGDGPAPPAGTNPQALLANRLHPRGKPAFVATKRPWVVDVVRGWGGFYEGTLQQLALGFTMKPNTHLAMSASAERNDVVLPQGRFIRQILTLRADYSLTPNVSYANRAQYDNESRVAGLQSRFRWILQPGNDLFLVLNRGWQRSLTNDRFEPLFDRGSAKLQYTVRL